MTEVPRVSCDDLDVDQDRIVTWNRAPFTGIAIEEYDDSKARTETAYVGGIRHGESREWDPSGILRERATFWRGARHGDTSTFDADGRPAADETYEFGVLTRRRRWTASGTLAKEWTIGPTDDLYRILQLSRAKYGDAAQ
jgi:antitoxin component YwqK of YwqJK toxin-antitoxin module